MKTNYCIGLRSKYAIYTQLHYIEDCQHLILRQEISVPFCSKLHWKLCIKLIIITIMMLSTTIALCSLFHLIYTFHTLHSVVYYIYLFFATRPNGIYVKTAPEKTPTIHHIYTIQHYFVIIFTFRKVF